MIEEAKADGCVTYKAPCEGSDLILSGERGAIDGVLYVIDRAMARLAEGKDRQMVLREAEYALGNGFSDVRRNIEFVAQRHPRIRLCDMDAIRRAPRYCAGGPMNVAIAGRALGFSYAHSVWELSWSAVGPDRPRRMQYTATELRRYKKYLGASLYQRAAEVVERVYPWLAGRVVEAKATSGNDGWSHWSITVQPPSMSTKDGR